MFWLSELSVLCEPVTAFAPHPIEADARRLRIIAMPNLVEAIEALVEFNAIGYRRGAIAVNDLAAAFGAVWTDFDVWDGAAGYSIMAETDWRAPDEAHRSGNFPHPLAPGNVEVFAPDKPLTACDERHSLRFRDGSLDMGTGYDCFDPLAHLMVTGLTGQQRANRMLLATLMTQVGFAGYRYEWWHFTLRDEPYPNTYFDFPVR